MQKENTPPKPNVDLGGLNFQDAFAKACGKDVRYQKGYFRANFNFIDQQLLANIHHFIDTYKPSELNQKRSGTGIVVMACK